MTTQINTHPVSDRLFRAVYDSPASLPGRYKWPTSEEDVRKIEEILGMQLRTIGAPLWVGGDRKRCVKCRREINWLDGEQKFVNTEAPRAIAALQCFRCKTPFEILRSFKCHNWVYANEALLRVLQHMGKAAGKVRENNP
jgi:hypothetical protein